MVGYVCKYCKKTYETFKQAEKCEKQGLIGPDLKPGLLLAHKEIKMVLRFFIKN